MEPVSGLLESDIMYEPCWRHWRMVGETPRTSLSNNQIEQDIVDSSLTGKLLAIVARL